MNKDPQEYVNGNKIQRVITKNILEEIFKNFQWRKSGGYKILDVGCGAGDVTTEILMPMLPQNFEKIVGVDKLVKYIKFAKDNYSPSDRRVSYHVMDIESVLPREFEGQFHLVTSFFCLHWVQNYKQAIENMAKCLQPGGNIILIFVVHSEYFDFLCNMANTSKWAPYLSDASLYISPMHKMKDPEKEYSLCLEDTGFHNVNCEERKAAKSLDRMEYIAFLKPINPLTSRISKNQLEEYYDDLLEEYVKTSLYEDTVDGRKYIFNHSIMIVHAQKL